MLAVQVLVVLLVNELSETRMPVHTGLGKTMRLKASKQAHERTVPVLGTILTNGLRALVLGVHPGSSIPHGIRFFFYGKDYISRSKV